EASALAPRSRNTWRGQHVLAPALAGDAAVLERTAGAERPPPHASGRAEIHDRLSVRCDLRSRRALLRAGPELPGARRGRGIAFDPKIAREHALRIAIEYRVTLAAREREDGPGGGATHAGQRCDLLEALRESAAELIANAKRGAMQIARTCVVAEPRPQMQHLIERGGREGGRIREALHEPHEIRNHRRNLRLLEHDLRDPDAIG